MSCQSNGVMPIKRCHANQTVSCQSNGVMPIKRCHANQTVSCQSNGVMPIKRCHANQRFYLCFLKPNHPDVKNMELLWGNNIPVILKSQLDCKILETVSSHFPREFRETISPKCMPSAKLQLICSNRTIIKPHVILSHFQLLIASTHLCHWILRYNL